MRAVVFEDVGKVRVEEVERPSIADPADAVVRVTASAICGSDLHIYQGKAVLSAGDSIGHEGVGVVEEVGEAVTSVAPGDRVAIAFDIACGRCWFCRSGQTSLCGEFRALGFGTFGGHLGGTQAEYVRVPVADQNLLALPDDLSDERALFLGDALTTGYYGAAIAGIRPGDTVAVVGAGAIGFFAAQSALLYEPSAVLSLDLLPDRLKLAETVGATPINVAERNAEMAVAELTGGRGADVVIEAVGAVPALDSALDVVRSGGTVCLIGVYVTETKELQLGVVWARMLRLVFGGVCPVHAWWGQAMEAVRVGKIDPLPIVSHTLPLEEAPAGYELFARREATKVVLTP